MKKNKRQLITFTQENIIVCDHCPYVVENPTKDPNVDIKSYINKPCPKCGANLLTEHDYKLSLKTMKIVNWINKWFSWLAPKNPTSTIKEVPFEVSYHEKIKIKIK